MKRLPTALAAALLLAAPAHAGEPWTEPTDASSAEGAYSPLIAFDADGRSLLAYETWQGGRSTTHVLTGAGERQLGGAVGGLLQFGDRAFLLARRNGSRLLVSRLASDGRGRSRRVTGRADDQAVAANIRGRGALAWIDAQSNDHHAVRVRIVRASGRLSPTVTVGTADRISDVAVAVGARGQTAVVWAEQHGWRRHVVARVLDRGARRYGPDIRLGRYAGLARIDASFGASGRLYAAYTSQDAGERADRPFVVRWATVGVSARRVRDRGRLERSTIEERPLGRLRVQGTADGRATVAYTAVERSALTGRVENVVRAATAGGGGRFRAPVTLATAAALGDLVESPNGDLLAVWARVRDGAWDGIGAAVKPLGRRFGPAEEVASDERVTLPTAAFSQVSNRPTAVWAGAVRTDGALRIRRAERAPRPR